METASPVIQIGLWVMSLLVIGGAVWVVWLGNLFRAALSLGLVFVGVAGLFVLLEAEFLAFVQILIYVGAILTLVVFAIMLTATRQSFEASPPPRQPLPAALCSGALFVVLVLMIRALPPPQAPMSDAVSLSELGRTLITTLVLPFEVISLVFVAAMVGAIAVAASPRAQDQPIPPPQAPCSSA